MKREAVQEERQRTKERGEMNEVESSTHNGGNGNGSFLGLGSNGQSQGSPPPPIMPAQAPGPIANYTHDSLLQQIFEAEMRIDIKLKKERITDLKEAVKQQVAQLFEWAKTIPHFSELYLEDQCSLVKAGWNELLIAEFAHRSIEATNALVLANGIYINDQAAISTGISDIFQRVLTELVSKMREMQMDKTELGCLRAVVLFNPGTSLIHFLS